MSDSDNLHPENLPDASGWPIHPAMVTSAAELPGFRIVRSYGVVRGLVVRSPGLSAGLTASLQAISGGNVEAAAEVGKRIAERAKEKGIQAVAFDRSGFRYHGRVKALADAAREGGLEF